MFAYNALAYPAMSSSNKVRFAMSIGPRAIQRLRPGIKLTLDNGSVLTQPNDPPLYFTFRSRKMLEIILISTNRKNYTEARE